MKALTVITLANGDTLRSPRRIDVVMAMWAQMHRAGDGSIFQLETVNGRGQIKAVGVLAGTIIHVDEI